MRDPDRPDDRETDRHPAPPDVRPGDLVQIDVGMARDRRPFGFGSVAAVHAVDADGIIATMPVLGASVLRFVPRGDYRKVGRLAWDLTTGKEIDDGP